ncbi:MAG: PilZ domain-containing protein [Candidatus Acidiferrales bacterium]
MQDHGHKKHYHTAAATPSSVKEAERRGTERHTFTAAADVRELSSGAKFSTRTTDLGPGGCFVDTTNPFPVGSRVSLNLHKGSSNFETIGTVVYSQNGLGMGVAFNDLNAAQQQALADWLSEVTGERVVVHEQSQTTHVAKRASDFQHRAESAGLVRLVRLMITKGILTEAEGSSVLIDPVL